MTQYTAHHGTNGTLCTTCRHIGGSKAYCDRKLKTTATNPPRVIQCAGYSEAPTDPANTPVIHSPAPGTRPDTVSLIAAVLAFVVITTWTLGGALPASGQGEGGYPAPYLTATWVMPEATHNPGPTNTPVPGAQPAAWLALTAEARAVGVAAWGGAPWRVWIVAVGR